MKVYIGEAKSTVEAEREAATPKPQESSIWQEADHLRALLERRGRDAQRTRTEGHDD